jgi:hypothetical protein
MTHRDPDNESVTNPNDPCQAYGAATATKTPPNSAALDHRTTGQAHTGT